VREPAPGAEAAGVALADWPSGAPARLVASRLPSLETRLLAAMGLTLGARLVVRNQGDPTIVEVRATRIGLARAVAARLLVVAEPAAP